MNWQAEFMKKILKKPEINYFSGFFISVYLKFNIPLMMEVY